MKKFKLAGICFLIAALGFALTACAPFEGFDDDSAIIKSNSFSTVSSYSNKTSTSYSLRCGNSNGVSKLKKITVPENPVFDMTLKIEEGRFKVVLIKDDTVYTVCDSDTSGPVPAELAAGEYTLKIVAEDAKVDFTFNFNSYK